MARRAQLGILLQHLPGVEARAVGIEAAPLHHGMAGEAIPFHVARNATLERLARGVSMAQRKLPVAIVIASYTQQRTPRREPRLLVATLAELAGVVTVGARRRSRVCIRRMSRDKRRGVIGAARTWIRLVAREAFVAGVAAGAGAQRGGSDGTMTGSPPRYMTRRRTTRGLRPDRTSRSRGEHRPRTRRCPGLMTGQATLPRVTALATRGIARSRNAVIRFKCPRDMGRRCLQEMRQQERTWVEFERLDCFHLGRIDVARSAEVPGVAHGAAFRHDCTTGAVLRLRAMS